MCPACLSYVTVAEKQSLSQGKTGPFLCPFLGHLGAAATWLGNATRADQECMCACLKQRGGTSDPLPGSICTQISPGSPTELRTFHQGALNCRRKKPWKEWCVCSRARVHAYIFEGLSFKNYIRNMQNIYMILSLFALNKTKCFQLLSSCATLFTQNIFAIIYCSKRGVTLGSWLLTSSGLTEGTKQSLDEFVIYAVTLNMP